MLIKKLFSLEKLFLYSKLKINKKTIKNIKNFLKKNYKLKIYIKKEGCGGEKYKFKKKKKIKKSYIIIKKKNINIITDKKSYIYIINSKINYKNYNLLINNINIKNICDCGVSFKI